MKQGKEKRGGGVKRVLVPLAAGVAGEAAGHKRSNDGDSSWFSPSLAIAVHRGRRVVKPRLISGRTVALRVLAMAALMS